MKKKNHKKLPKQFVLSLVLLFVLLLVLVSVRTGLAGKILSRFSGDKDAVTLVSGSGLSDEYTPGQAEQELINAYSEGYTESSLSETESRTGASSASSSEAETVPFDPASVPAWDGVTPYVFVNGDGTFTKPDVWDGSDYASDDTKVSLSADDLNGGTPFFTEEDMERAATESWETYSPLDALGRCGTAYADLCTDLMPAEGEDRGEIGSVRPSGWNQAKYPDLVEGNYLYNRCHLIGWALAGENANEQNLITGTRYLNIQGMLSHENFVRETLRDGAVSHILYRVTPVYDGDGLLASGVLMEACSVEDKGQSVDFCIYAYNEQPGITIDHADGSSQEG